MMENRKPIRARMRRSVPGYAGRYEVSEDGHVCSIARTETSRAGWSRRHPGGRLTEFRGRKGYLQVRLCASGAKKTKWVARLVAEAFVPNPEQKPHVNHIDGDRTNNAAENLEWMTPAENNHHAASVLGAFPRGENSHAAKLAERDVRAMRAARLLGASYSSLGREYGIHPHSVSRICKRTSWAWLQPAADAAWNEARARAEADSGGR